MAPEPLMAPSLAPEPSMAPAMAPEPPGAKENLAHPLVGSCGSWIHLHTGFCGFSWVRDIQLDTLRSAASAFSVQLRSAWIRVCVQLRSGICVQLRSAFSCVQPGYGFAFSCVQESAFSCVQRSAAFSVQLRSAFSVQPRSAFSRVQRSAAFRNLRSAAFSVQPYPYPGVSSQPSPGAAVSLQAGVPAGLCLSGTGPILLNHGSDPPPCAYRICHHPPTQAEE